MDIADVKRELSSDEKVLESAFKLETVYKKYKVLLWGVAVALVLFFVGRSAFDALHQAKLAEANEAFLTLQEKPDNAEALATLEAKNPALFELFSYAQAVKAEDVKQLRVLQKSQNFVIADLSSYSANTLERKPATSQLYKEMALLDEAYLALKAGNTQEAQRKLEGIDQRSVAKNIVTLLQHATLKVK